MSDDKLQNHRDVSKRDNKVFVNWLSVNCVQAVSIEEAKKITEKIKKPISKAVEDE